MKVNNHMVHLETYTSVKENSEYQTTQYSTKVPTKQGKTNLEYKYSFHPNKTVLTTTCIEISPT